MRSQTHTLFPCPKKIYWTGLSLGLGFNFLQRQLGNVGLGMCALGQGGGGGSCIPVQRVCIGNGTQHSSALVILNRSAGGGSCLLPLQMTLVWHRGLEEGGGRERQRERGEWLCNVRDQLGRHEPNIALQE